MKLDTFIAMLLLLDIRSSRMFQSRVNICDRNIFTLKCVRLFFFGVPLWKMRLKRKTFESTTNEMGFFPNGILYHVIKLHTFVKCKAILNYWFIEMCHTECSTIIMCMDMCKCGVFFSSAFCVRVLNDHIISFSMAVH